MLHFLVIVASCTILCFSCSAPAFDVCQDHTASCHTGSAEAVSLSLKNEMKTFTTLSEQALALRAGTIKAGMIIREKLDNGKPLSGDDIALINTGINQHLRLRKELLAVAEAHECWLDMPETELRGMGITAKNRLTGVMMSLASALVLYDNYLLAISLFEGDAKLRRILNERDPGYAVTRKALAKVTLHYNSVNNRARVRRAIKFYEQEAPGFENELKTSPDIAYLSDLIAQSPSYQMVEKWSPLYVLGRQLGFLQGMTADELIVLERKGINIFSMVFGNGVGLVEFRRGKLYRKSDVLTDVQSSLNAGDILLEKTPFRLTDKLIPGYWGHAAIWIGTEQELKDLGIWNNPVVVRYCDEIHEGRLVVEALRSGVEMNTLQHFLNIDSIGILRPSDARPAERADAILRALRQVGKPYDFNFDVESKGQVYCSKLVYLSYGDINWPTHKSIGGCTFAPDDVAMMALRENRLSLVCFYHDGKRVDDEPLIRMAGLMGVRME